MARVVPVNNSEDFLESLSSEESFLLVRAAADPAVTEEERQESIAILSATEGLGQRSQAFLVYGIPNSGQFSFFDLNNLPPNYIAEITIGNASGTVFSKNLWKGTDGNAPQPTE